MADDHPMSGLRPRYIPHEYIWIHDVRSGTKELVFSPLPAAIAQWHVVGFPDNMIWGQEKDPAFELDPSDKFIVA